MFYISQVLNQLLYLMRTAEKSIKIRIALALAHLCDPKDGKLIFMDNNGKNLIFRLHFFLTFLLLVCRFWSIGDTNAGVELLLELLYFSSVKQQRYSSSALYELAKKVASFAPEDSAPASPTQRVNNLHFVFQASKSFWSEVLTCYWLLYWRCFWVKNSWTTPLCPTWHSSLMV